MNLEEGLKLTYEFFKQQVASHETQSLNVAWFSARGDSVRPAEGTIFEAESPSFRRREQIAPVHDQRPGHGFADSVPIELAEFVPFRGDQQGLGILGGFVGGFRIFDLREHGAGSFHCLRIVGADARSFGEQVFHEFDGRGEANVVGIGFEGQAQDADLFPADHPERCANFLEETVDALAC